MIPVSCTKTYVLLLYNINVYKLSCDTTFSKFFKVLFRTHIDVPPTHGPKPIIVSFVMKVHKVCISNGYFGIFRTILKDSILDSLFIKDMSSSVKSRRECTSS